MFYQLAVYSMSLLIGNQEPNKAVGDVLAARTINDAIETLNYWNEHKEKTTLTDGEKLSFLLGSSAYGIKRNKTGQFEFSKSVSSADIKTRDEVNQRVEKNMTLMANGDLLVGQPLLVFSLGNYGSLGGASYSSCKIIQVVDKSTLLVMATIKSFKETEFHTFFVKGVNTNQFVDGGDFYYEILFAITGTQTYTTTLGASKKVYVLEAASQETLNYAANKVKEGFGPVWKKEADKLAAEIEEKKAQDKKKKELMLEKKIKEDAESKQNKIKAANLKANESITKLTAGLASYTKRYEESFNESNPKLADQMQAQAVTYIQNGDKRLADAIKDVKASTLPEEEKAALIKQATEALTAAKKKVGVK